MSANITHKLRYVVIITMQILVSLTSLFTTETPRVSRKWVFSNGVESVKHNCKRRQDPQRNDGNHHCLANDCMRGDVSSGAVAGVFAPYDSKDMSCSPGCSGTTCKQPNEDKEICGLLASYFTQRRAADGVIAVYTYDSQCHDVHSKTSEHREKP